jgi:hypothetical protein
MYGERYMDTPAENKKGFDEASVMNYAKDLKGKLLLIHGTSDDVVVMQHGLALVKKFVDLGIQMDFFPYPMHKHNVIGGVGVCNAPLSGACWETISWAADQSSSAILCLSNGAAVLFAFVYFHRCQFRNA